MAIFEKRKTSNGEAHNFVSWRDFDNRIFAFKTWDTADADRRVARVNRATRVRAIGTYLRRQSGSLHL